MVIGVTLDQATGWATVALAALTLVLAAAAIYQASVTRTALALADRDTTEAIKSRIDQQAPRVVIYALALAGSTRFWNSNGGEIIELRPGDPIADDAQQIGLMGWFRLENEGKSTAIVTVPPGTLAFPKEAGMVSLNHQQVKHERPSRPGIITIGPGDGRLLLVQAPRSFGEWKEVAQLPEADRPAISLPVLVEDTFQDGIEDQTTLCFFGTPIMNPGGEWVGGASQATRLVVTKAVRRYPGLDGDREGPDTRPPGTF